MHLSNNNQIADSYYKNNKAESQGVNEKVLQRFSYSLFYKRVTPTELKNIVEFPGILFISVFFKPKIQNILPFFKCIFGPDYFSNHLSISL